MIACSPCPATGRKRPLTAVCQALKVPRSSVYWERRGSNSGECKGKRGPKTKLSDRQLLVHIREVIASSPFAGEGYRKVRARLRRERGVHSGGKRVLRLMRQNGLLAPQRPLKPERESHSGKITTDRPNEMWGADGTRVWTSEEGWGWVFSAVDHHSAKAWTEAVKVGDRFAALEPVRRAVRLEFGYPEADVARGLSLRHDHGSQYTSNDFQGEMRFLGIHSTPAYVGEPECNGVAERFFRTLKEQCLWVSHFRTIEEARMGVAVFTDLYNREWLIEKNGHRTPDEVHGSCMQVEEVV